MALLLICRHTYFCVSLTPFQTSLLSTDLFFSYFVSILLTPFRQGSARGVFGTGRALSLLWAFSGRVWCLRGPGNSRPGNSKARANHRGAASAGGKPGEARGSTRGKGREGR